MKKELSTHDKIMRFFLADPSKQYLVSDIVSFIGYEAGIRIGDLCRRGLLFRSGDQERKRGRPFAIYALTDLGKKFIVPEIK